MTTTQTVYIRCPRATASWNGRVSWASTCAAPQRCAGFLSERWVDGKCTLKTGVTATGYSGYGNTLEEHYPTEQAANTLLFPPKLVSAARDNVSGFGEIVDDLTAVIKRVLGLDVSLHSAHGLRQGPATASSSIFGWHHDDEEIKTIHLTACVKLTPDIPNEETSKMNVAGARETFEYGPQIGSTAIFFSCLEHASVVPSASQQHDHLKMTFFFSFV